MRSRRQRFQRLLAVRERELEDRRVESVRARTALRETRIALEKSQGALREAVERARYQDGVALRIDDLSVAAAWVEAKVKEVEEALKNHNLARERERLTTLMMQKAEKEKRKIEKLLERIILEEQQVQAVLEQKETDEVAARKLAERGAVG